MKRRLTDILVCPVCRSSLKLHSFTEEIGESGVKEIIDGILTCSCERWYPIIGGIPRMLPDNLRDSQVSKRYSLFMKKYMDKLPKRLKEASIETDTRLKRDTLESFGFQWNKFNEMFPEFRENFLNYINPINPAFFNDKLVLDVGCGFGRHTYYSAEFGAEVVGIDLSHAVEAAYKNVSKFPKAHIVQGDIYNLPFKNKFDFIFSIGVIHHLPDPEGAYLGLVEFAREGSSIFIWVYGREGRRFKVEVLGRLRKITRKLPHRLLYYLCYFPAMLYHSSNLLYRALDSNRLTRGLALMVPFKGYAKFPFRVKHADAFDFLATPEDNYYLREDMKRWVSKAGLKDTWITDIEGRSWRVFGTKR
jgi:uncharacterized protein YbaR (Trm112 family)